MTLQEKLLKIWVLEMRDTIVTSQILRYRAKSLKSSPLTITEIRKPLERMVNALATANAEYMNLIMILRKSGKASTFNEIVTEFTADKIHDLANHLDFIYQFDNISEITNLLHNAFKSDIENAHPGTTNTIQS